MWGQSEKKNDIGNTSNKNGFIFISEYILLFYNRDTPPLKDPGVFVAVIPNTIPHLKET